MKTHLVRLLRIASVLCLLGASIMLPSTPSGAEHQPGVGEGTGAAAGTSEGGPVPESGDNSLGLFRTINIHGGYVAKGVAMRNLGRGSIKIDGIPKGAKTYAAYLYWNVLAIKKTTALSRGKINGTAITGISIGTTATPCWDDVRGPNKFKSYSYRASVPISVASGNGAYNLSGFASGSTVGEDPWTYWPDEYYPDPLLEGATLVIVYSKADYPLTKIILYDGAAETTSNQVSLTISGFNATDPVGPAFTTFIGADGQDGWEPGSYFNGLLVPSIDWDGTDPRVTTGSHGNLWDTETVSVTTYLKPGDTSVTASTMGSTRDCLVWVGQVFSMSPGNVDTDGDNLLDGWEFAGYQGKDLPFLNLPAMGSNYLHKDIFVEADWMGASGGDPSHKPVPEVISRAATMFKNAPLKNPDTKNGVTIHVDDGSLGGGNEVTHQDDLGTCDASLNYDWGDFQTIKTANFGKNREKIFHYVIFAHDLCAGLGSTSGVSRGIPESDFIVSLGSWTGHVGTANEQTGTFIHELGHNLGLKHGGNDHVNYKPNYISLMNYLFQTTGLRKNGADGIWNYSWTALPSLNETKLNETKGLSGGSPIAGYGTKYYCGAVRKTVNNANGPIDWSCDGSAAQVSVSRDINHDGSKTTLGTQNNWANITYDGGLIGIGAKPSARPGTTAVQELTYEEAYPTGQ